eukprot:gene4772-biopygen8392
MHPAASSSISSSIRGLSVATVSLLLLLTATTTAVAVWSVGGRPAQLPGSQLADPFV